MVVLRVYQFAVFHLSYLFLYLFLFSTLLSADQVLFKYFYHYIVILVFVVAFGFKVFILYHSLYLEFIFHHFMYYVHFWVTLYGFSFFFEIKIPISTREPGSVFQSDNENSEHYWLISSYK